ncbi:MAG: UDP-3-O-acyl-N-acetylglucosamine deacetylase [Deltaproteobacteria bacterium]|nr:UDP-3-O-acyl-N-acetylglucosamine deacetylase [Deltaproteobacteria bacterium]
MLQQRTVRANVHGSGVGLHSGVTTNFCIRPAEPDTGIVFVRTDLSPHVEIPAHARHVVATRLATTIGAASATIGTVEHVLATLYGLGVDNARIEVDGPEMPILDGSAADFVELICASGGTVAQRRPKRFLVVRRAVEVEDADTGRFVRLEPATSFHIRASIDFDHPLVSNQRFEIAVSDTAFVREIARARTFCFAKDIEKMRAAGLALGGSVENAVVIDDFSIRNPDGLRFPDEFVRHKVLDAIGDLSLVGAPIIGRYIGVRGGHMMNASLISSLLSDARAFELFEFNRKTEAVGHALELPDFRVGRLATA